MFFFQNLTAELLLFESPDDSYFPKSGGSTFLKTVGSHFSEICGNKVTAYMDYPDYTFYDTLTASREHFGKSLPNHQLHTVSAACGYDLENHHHALADAEACATIAMKILNF